MQKKVIVWRATIETVFNQRKAKGWYIEGATYASLSKIERQDIKDEAQTIYLRRIGV